MTKKPSPLTPNSGLAKIRLLCCDVDGVLTDGGLYYGSDGRAFVRFYVLDGQGINRLRARGVKVCFITQSKSGLIEARAKDLGIEYCFAGIEDKLTQISRLANEIGLALDEVAHIADDVNDIPLLKAVGIAVAVPGAVPEVMQIAHFVTAASGGNGAVRELCESIIASLDRHRS